MATEVWFYNPHSYVREMVEVGVGNVAWDRGALVKRRIDPLRHADLYFGKSIPWRLLLIGDQGAADYDANCARDKPRGVYPVWEYGDDFNLLEEFAEFNIGDNEEICSGEGDPTEVPVFGQEHRVVVTKLPNAITGPGRRFLTLLRELQEDNPHCIIHIHGGTPWRSAFGYGLRAATVEPRLVASKGKVILPNGRVKNHDYLFVNPQWAAVLGYKPSDLTVPRNRCMYNIKSALWAAENYTEFVRFKTNRSGDLVPKVDIPDSEFVKPEAKSDFSVAVKPQEGDKITCDTCSLQDKCKHFREGSVCTLPQSEPRELAEMFASRDADVILDGLSTLLSAQSKRLKRGMRDEVMDGEIDPKVTALANSIFAQAVQMAKLVDPNLRGGAKVQVNVNGGASAQVLTATPQQMMASIVAELESRGIPRSEITPEMIKGLLESKAGGSKAIAGEVVHRD